MPWEGFGRDKSYHRPVFYMKKTSQPRPEGNIEYYTSEAPDGFINTLKGVYHYSETQIEVNSDYFSQTISITVYRDRSHKMPLLYIIPYHKADDPNNLNEISKKARSIGTEYYVIGTPSDYNIFKINYRNGHDDQASSIPFWSFGFAWDHPIEKHFTLPPFRDEQELRKVIQATHNSVYTSVGFDPAAAFDLIARFILTKTYDEFSEFDYYQFYVNESLPKEDELERLKKLFIEAESWFNGTQDREFGENFLSILPDDVFLSLIQAFAPYSFKETTDAASGTDIKGVVYESMVGSTFRGELGSYFTPRNIADFMVGMLSPTDQSKIFDPSCGSGGFLISSIRYMKEKYKNQLLDYLVYGVDINPRMVRAAKLNLIMNGASPSNIIQSDGLELENNAATILGYDITSGFSDSQLMLEKIPQGPFDYVFANPPFAGYEKDASKLEKFHAAYREDGSLRSLNKTIPFIEMIIASLKEGGKAGIVIPISILNAQEDSFQDLREIITESTEILAVIGLPRTAFYHTDCGVEGALLFLKRTRAPREHYDIFIDWATSVGYDRQGNPVKANDLIEIISKFKSNAWSHENTVNIQEFIRDGRFDPAWWKAKKQKNTPSIDVAHNYAQITEYFEIRKENFSRRSISDTKLYKYFEVRDTNIDTGEIRQVHEISGSELRKKGRIKQIVRTGDILLPNHRDSLIAKSSEGFGRSVVLVSEEFDGCLTTDRYIMLEPLISPYFLIAMLNSKEVREQLVMHSRGAASLDIRNGVLEKIYVPRIDCSSLNHLEIVGDIEENYKHEQELIKNLSNLRNSRSQTISDLFKKSGCDSIQS